MKLNGDEFFLDVVAFYSELLVDAHNFYRNPVENFTVLKAMFKCTSWLMWGERATIATGDEIKLAYTLRVRGEGK